MPVHRVEFADDGRCVVVTRHDDAQDPVWSLRVDATAGHPDLRARGYLRALGDLLLLFTEGEHARAGSAHRWRVHAIDPAGAVRWSLRLQVVGEPLRLGEHLLLPVRWARSPRGPEGPDELHVQVRDPDTGALLETYPVRPPPVLERAYTHAVRGLGARLEPEGERLRVTVSAWFTGSHAPPRGAGDYDVLLAL
jgi:hypothetical protein